MDLSAVHPDLRRATARLPGPGPGRAALRWVARVTLLLLPTRRTEGVVITSVRDGSVRARVYRPAAATGAALLWVHGGGLVMGAARMDDAHCGETARALGVVVVSADYRLAPRHPYPAALDDVHAAWHWLLDHAVELGVDPRRVAVGGQSAGGGLAAALAHRLLDEGGPQPAAQWLFCPMLDDRTAARRELDEPRHLVWDNGENRYGWGAYLGRPPGSDPVPDHAVPARRLDLGGLPPAWLDASTIELFHDEIVAYAGRLRAAGVPKLLDIVKGAPHGFETWAADTPPARALLGRARSWLAEALAPTAAS